MTKKKTPETLRSARRRRQLRQIDAIEAGSNIVGRPWQKSRRNGRVNFSAGPLRICVPNFQVQVVKRADRVDVHELQFFQVEFVDPQLSFGLHPANQVTSVPLGGLGCSAEK